MEGSWWETHGYVHFHLVSHHRFLRGISNEIGLVHETTTFIAEAAEDENDLVVKEAHRLKNTVESITGPLDI